ncbi:MAG: NAD(P)-dependent oxidoreductase [Candidatus Eisenbacteria bacterium]
MPEAALSVHVQELSESWAPGRLRARLDPGVRLTVGPDLPDAADYDVLVAGRPTPSELAASSSLKMLVIPWSGLPQSTRLALLERPEIAVHNIHHNAAPAAEMAVALMLAASKSIVPVDRSMRRDDWSPRYEPGRALLLEGRTAVVLGYGAIGRRIAAACRALGMSVTALKRRPGDVEPGCPDRVLPPDALHDVLPGAGVLQIALPHTDATRGLIGERELSLLPSDSVVVNVARAPIVDEEALFRALSEGSIRAAGLDVWYAYPKSEESRVSTPPSRFPFRDLDNVVMSPHRAGAFAVREVEEARVDALAATLNAAAAGGPVPHPVDVREGY